MELLKNIGRNDLKIDIGIDRMPIQNDLKLRVLEALQHNEDFALKNDSGGYAYFINKEFMIVITPSGKDNNVQHLKDENSLQNALKLALLGHSQFVPSNALLLNNGYLQLKKAATEEIKQLII